MTVFATGSEVRVGYSAESTFGTIPTTPTFTTTRITGGGLRTNKTTGVSAEMQADRNVRDEFLLGLDVAGSYNFELSYGTFDDLLANGMMGTWSSNVLQNGVLQSSFTFEETLNLNGAPLSFSRYSGVMVASFMLDITARKEITGTFTMMGKQETLDTAILSGATYTAPSTATILTASANAAGLSVAGLTPQPKIRRVQFEVNNNLRVRPEIGSQYSDYFGAGRADVTGTIEAYFDSNALYAAVLAHGGGDLSITLGVSAGTRYTIDMPNIVFLNGARPIGGQDQDIIATVPFRARYNSGTGASVSITRGV